MVVVSVILNAPIDEVWADVSDLASHVEWMADADSITFADDRRSGVGTVMEVVTRVGPLKTMDVIEVTDWDPPHRIGVVHRGVVTGTGAFVLEPSGIDRTRFTWEESLEMPWYFGGDWAAPISNRVLELIWKRNLKRLQARF